MEILNFFAQDAQGNIMPSAECYLYAPGTTNLVSGLVDINGMPISNPFQASNIGQVQFGAPNGVYDLRMKKGVRDTTIRIQCADLLQALNETASFLGARATAPTTRTDGTPLQLADRYLNTTDQIEYIYKSSGWVANNLDGQILATRLGASTIGAIMQDGSTGTVQQAIDIGDNALRKELASDDGAALIGFKSSLPGAVPTDLEKIIDDGQSICAKFGIVADGVADDSDAIQAALFSTNRAIIFPAAKYRITRTLYRVQGLIVGEGFQTQFIFEGLNGADGIVFAPTSYANTSGAINLSMIVKGSNGGRAFSTPYAAAQYNTLYSNWRWENLNFAGATSPAPGTNNAFETIETWACAIEQGDGFSCTISKIYVRGNYRSDSDPGPQVKSCFLRMTAASALLTTYVSMFTVSNLYRGVEIGDRVFFNIKSFDIAHTWDGIYQIGLPGSVYGESRVSSGNINAQHFGIFFDSAPTREISDVVIRRHKFGWKGATHDFAGIRILNSSYVLINKCQVAPNEEGGAFTGTHYGLQMVDVGGLNASSIIVNPGIDRGFLLDNCTMVTIDGVQSFQNSATDIIFRAINNTRASRIGAYTKVSTFSGTDYSSDATILPGAVQQFQRNVIPEANTPQYIWRRTSSALNEKIWKAASGATTWALQASSDDDSSSINAMIVTRSGTSIPSVDIRAVTTITANLRPSADNIRNLGDAAFRWATVYAATGAINTSDARHKTDVRAMSAAEIDVAKALLAEIGMYQFLDSVAENGADAARWHVGMTVQRAIEIFEAHGLDPFRNAFVCYDEWEDQYEEYAAEYEMHPGEFDSETGKEISPAYEVLVKPAGRTLIREAGNIYSFRNDQLAFAMLAGVAATQSALELRISALEKLNA